MSRLRAATLLTVLFTAASVATPYAQEPTRARFTSLPSNPYCLAAGCGYGRDGVPEPYAGSGLSGRSARAYAKSGSAIFPASNTVLMSWLSSSDMVGKPVNASDIWGYVSPSGREYAIVGVVTGTVFVEVTDPGNPKVVGLIAGRPSDWRDMAVFGEYAYSVNESGGGVQVIDLTRIDRGKVRELESFTESGLWTAHNIQANPDSGYVYLLGANVARGGLVVLDVRDPATPRLEPIAWDTAYVHDVQVVSYDEGRYAGREIAFAFTGTFGIHIVDITDKGNPTTLANLRYDNATYGHSGALSSDRKFLYVNDELDERVGAAPEMTTHVIRISNLRHPRLVRQVRWGIPAIDHNSMVQGDRLYMSSYHGGLRVLDVKKRGNPSALGYFDTFPADDAALFSGAWGVFAGFPSGNVIVSDIERGLFVIRAP